MQSTMLLSSLRARMTPEIMIFFLINQNDLQECDSCPIIANQFTIAIEFSNSQKLTVGDNGRQVSLVNSLMPRFSETLREHARYPSNQGAIADADLIGIASAKKTNGDSSSFDKFAQFGNVFGCLEPLELPLEAWHSM